MKTLTNLTLINLKQNRSRTIMTIVGVALSVALILACIGFFTSLNYTERQDSVIRFGDYHVMYKDIPGDKISIIENYKDFEVKFYSNPVGCVMTSYGFADCEGLSPYSVDDYERIDDANTLVRDSEHKYNVFLYYRIPQDSDRSDKFLTRALEDSGVSEVHRIKNYMVAHIDGDAPETSRILSFWVSFIFIGSMSIIAAFVIRNSFNISITERVRQFGMLASVGARPRQIRAMVYKEGLFIGLIAIPLGLLIGCAATLVVVGITNALIGFSDSTDMLFYIPAQAFGAITLAGIFIIFLSAASPAIVASRVSPIAALRNVQDIKVKAKKLKTSKLIEKMFGIGGVIAAKNLKRNRSKYRTTVISIVLSIAVFIGISSFMMYGHKAVELFNEDTGANVMVSAGDVGIFNDIIEKFKVKRYAIYSSFGFADLNGEYYTGPMIKVMSNDEFERYAKQAGVSSSDYSNVAILQDTLKGTDARGNTTLHRIAKYEPGDKITFSAAKYVYDENAVVKCNPDDLFRDKDSEEYTEEELTIREKCINGEMDSKGADVYVNSDPQTIEITHIADFEPLGISMLLNDVRGTLYISENHPVAKAVSEFTYLDMMYIADSGLGKDIYNYLSDTSTIRNNIEKYGEQKGVAYAVNMEEAMKTVRNLILLFEIIIYGFIVVAALIGVTNIFNTITTNIALRAKEFAILKSVGMTEDEFNRMIRLESILYTTRSLLIGLPVGFLMSYGVYKLFDEAAMEFGWLIPWGAVVISIVVVAALVAFIMHYSVRKIKKQNIIETIRKESF
ncbi:ABC transporter permease [Candidatus Saccharibacteria bacterium]|nr:ABC transporter permease [Candidatus Saccharibacteria bacterium]